MGLGAAHLMNPLVSRGASVAAAASLALASSSDPRSSLTADMLVSRRNLRKLSNVEVKPVEIGAPTIMNGGGLALLPPSTPTTPHHNNILNGTADQSLNTSDIMSKFDYTPQRPHSTQQSFDLSPNEPKANGHSHSNGVDGADEDSGLPPVLTRPGYFTRPSLVQLRRMSPEQLRSITGFTVAHEQFGRIEWEGATDVADLNLDELVVFEDQSSEVYPAGTFKHPEGHKLNKRARVTLYQCWPADKRTGRRVKTDDPRKLAKYEQKLKSYAENLGARFVSYDGESGEWCFEVDSF